MMLLIMMTIVGKRIKGRKRAQRQALVLAQLGPEEFTKGVMEKVQQLYGPPRAMDQR